MNYVRYLVFCCFSVITVAANSLVIGTISNAPPFEFLNGKNNLTGFDIDLMNALCKRIKKECSYKTYDFHKLFSLLNTGQIDLAIAGIMITPAREKQFLFSMPYKLEAYQYLTLSSTPLTAISQLPGKTIGIYDSSPDKAVVAKQFKDNINIKLYKHVEQMVSALQEKQVDVIMLESHRAAYWFANASNLKSLGEPFQAGREYGIAARQGNLQLIQEINQALQQIENDGTYVKIYKQYF